MIISKDSIRIIMDWTSFSNSSPPYVTFTKLKEIALYVTPVTRQHSLETEDDEPYPNYLITSKQLEVLIVARGESTADFPSLERHRTVCFDQEKYDFDNLNLYYHHGQIELRIPCIDNPEANAPNSDNALSIASSLSALTMAEQPPVKLPTTTIEVICDVGYGNSLSIVGTGPGMNWNQGIPLKNIGSNRWICEINSDKFKNFEFKILKNGKDYETGSNHTIECGKAAVITPKF